MRYRPLGRTGLHVSALSLGTVSLGVDYGINAPGEFGHPDARAAVQLLRDAAARGITLIDTAPAYGNAERLVGKAIGGDASMLVATKVNVAAASAISRSLDSSRRALSRDTLDIVQIHNATEEIIAAGEVADALSEARQQGVVRFIGASVYGEAAALAAIASGRFDVLQIAFNVLDQQMAARVLPAAEAAGIGVLVRSAFLKGALTPKAQWLPDVLAPLRDAAARARDLLAGGSWERLPDAAMRYCLSVPRVSSVLTGARTTKELDDALSAEAAGPMDARLLAQAEDVALDDERLTNPSLWPLP